MAGKYWESHAHEMNMEHSEMKSLADHVENKGQYANLDEPSQEQFKSLISASMKHIFTSQDNHFAGRMKAAHSNLLVAANHISAASRMLDGTEGASTVGAGEHPSAMAKQIATNYKDGYGSEF